MIYFLFNININYKQRGYLNAALFLIIPLLLQGCTRHSSMAFLFNQHSTNESNY